MPGVRSPRAVDIFAGLNGPCCRYGFVHGRSHDGRRWCTERPWCKKKYDKIHWMSTDEPGESRLTDEALNTRADALMASADAIYERIGPPPSRMVCEPCAAERKRAEGSDEVHELIEAQAAKRQRVE